ncbi:MAG: glycosyltransferase family 4 protein [Firmicutes bacterium]|nr:glycosyltransferase family 4 protein [Bacillota bacterium]
MITISQILQVLRPAAGGMLTHVEVLLAGLSQAGYDTTVACPIDENLMQRVRAAQVFRVLPLDVGDDLRPWLDPLVIRRFARFLRRQSFAIIHAHGAKAGLITRLALSYGSKLHYPVVVSYHNEILPVSRHSQKRRWRRFIERRLAKDTAHFIAVSPSIKAELIQVIGCPPEKVSCIPNGISLQELVDPDRAVGIRKAQRSQWDWPESSDTFVVGTACRLTEEKGIDILLAAAVEAVRVEKALRFVIIGAGPEGEKLRRVVEEMGLTDHVRFLGFCDTARNLFPAFDAFVLPSRTEGWPLSIMEAMVMGLPVIATRVGGIPHMVEAGQTGILVQPGQVRDLTEALILLARDRSRARRLGEAAAEYGREHFDARAMVAQVEKVYRQLRPEGWA